MFSGDINSVGIMIKRKLKAKFDASIILGLPPKKFTSLLLTY